MRMRSRILILAGLITAFVIIAPITILAALGYRYDFSQHRLERTGTLMVRTQPKGARIYLNGKLSSEKTPAVIRFLPPGDFEVKVEKEGYRTWQKRFTVMVDRVTAVFPENELLPLLRVPAEPELISKEATSLLAAPRTAYAIIATSTVALLDITSGKMLATDLSADPRAALSISPSGEWVFSENSGTMLAYSFRLKKHFDLTKLTGGFSSAGALDDRTLLIRTADGIVRKFNADTGSLTVRKRRVDDVTVLEGEFYFSSQGSAYRARAASSTPELIASGLPPHKSGMYLPISGGRVYAVFDDGLYVVGSSTSLIGSPVDFAAWNSADDTILAWNKNSLWLYDPDLGKEFDLLARSSTQLSSPLLLPEINLSAYLENGKLKAVEMLAEAPRNTIELVPDAHPSSYYVDPSDKYVYFIEKDKGLFRMPLR